MTEKQQVLKVYPDAFAHKVENGICILSVKKANETNNIVLGVDDYTEEQAWQNALNNLTTAQEANK